MNTIANNFRCVILSGPFLFLAMAQLQEQSLADVATYLPILFNDGGWLY